MVGAVNVFVDDAVQGRFPAVCARTGAPAESIERIDHRIGGPSPFVWVLLVLGPLGIALVVLAYAISGRETLTVRLPVGAAAWERELARRKVELAGWVLLAAALVAGFATFAGIQGAWFVLALLALVVAVAAHLVSSFHAPSVSIDASRRWVTIGNVDSAFVSAVQRRDEAPAPRS